MKKVILLLLLATSGVFGQVRQNGVYKIEPLTIISTETGEYAVLGYTNNWFAGKKYAFWESDFEGNIDDGGWYIVGTRSDDSTTTVSNTPLGWSDYTPPCVIGDGELVAYWNINDQLVELMAESFNDSLWLTQVWNLANPHEFIVRGKNMLDRGDVTFVSESFNTAACINLFAGGNTDVGGLVEPSTFTTPPNYTEYLDIDGVTTIYTNGTPPNNNIVSTYSFKDGKQYIYDLQGNATLIMDLELYESGGSIFVRDNASEASFTASFLGLDNIGDPNDQSTFPINETNNTIKYLVQGVEDILNNSPDIANGYNVSGWRGRMLQVTKAYVNNTTQGIPQMICGQVYVPTASNTLDTYEVLAPGDTLFYSPDSYSLPANGSALATFAETFPDEVYDTGAIKAIFYNNLGTDQANFTRVGLLNRIEGINGYANLTDAWLYNTGHPSISWTQAQFDSWYYGGGSSLLAGSFNNYVASRSGYGLVMLNDEAWTGHGGGGTWNGDMYNQVFGLYNTYRTTYPNSQLYPWGVQGYTMPQGVSGSAKTTLWNMWSDSKTLNKTDYDNAYPCGVGNYGCETGGSEVDVVGMYTVGNYFNSYRYTQEILFDAIHGFILGETYRPTLKGVFNIWSDIETIGDNGQGMITGKTSSGRAWRRFYKSAVFPADMYNAGAVSGFFHSKGGFIMWDYPNVAYTDNPDDWFEGFYLDDNSNFIANQNTDAGNLPIRQYANKSKQNIDEFMKGYWSINRNHDLLTGALEVPEIKINGSFVSQQESFWGAGLQHKRAFAAYRKVGDEALIFAANFYGSTATDLELRIFHNGVWVEKTIPIKGNYASVVRVTLDGNVGGGSGVPSDLFSSIGSIGYRYGDNYASQKAQVSGGDAIFNYFGNPSPNNSYPDQNPQSNGSSFATYTSDYVIVEWPSHSVNLTAEPTRSLTAKVHYKVYDSNNNLVLETYDTKGGRLPDGNRTNSHPDDVMRWIRKGTYRIEVENISTDNLTIDFTIGSTNDSGIDNLHSSSLSRGQSTSVTVTFDGSEFEPVWHTYKMRVNVN